MSSFSAEIQEVIQEKKPQVEHSNTPPHLMQTKTGLKDITKKCTANFYYCTFQRKKCNERTHKHLQAFLHTSTFSALLTTFVFRRHLFIRSGEYKHGERLKNARVLHHTTTALHRARNILSIFIAFPPNKKTTLFISILALLVITQKIVPQRSFVYCSSRPARYKLCKNFFSSLCRFFFFLDIIEWYTSFNEKLKNYFCAGE